MLAHPKTTETEKLLRFAMARALCSLIDVNSCSAKSSWAACCLSVLCRCMALIFTSVLPDLRSQANSRSVSQSIQRTSSLAELHHNCTSMHSCPPVFRGGRELGLSPNSGAEGFRLIVREVYRLLRCSHFEQRKEHVRCASKHRWHVLPFISVRSVWHWVYGTILTVYAMRGRGRPGRTQSSVFGTFTFQNHNHHNNNNENNRFFNPRYLVNCLLFFKY